MRRSRQRADGWGCRGRALLYTRGVWNFINILLLSAAGQDSRLTVLLNLLKVPTLLPYFQLQYISVEWRLESVDSRV